MLGHCCELKQAPAETDSIVQQTPALTYEIADSHIKDPAVPPALIEVGQHVLERQLHELKPDGQHPQQRMVPNDQCLQCTSATVSMSSC